MSPASGRDEDRKPSDVTLERVEQRVRRVQHLDPFHFSQREDGRFRCELEKPIEDLQPAEIREALAVLDTLAGLLREQLEEAGEE